jgi:hypothetical protein
VERRRSLSSVPRLRHWSTRRGKRQSVSARVLKSMVGRTSKASTHGAGVFAGAAQGLDFESAAFDFTYIELGVGAGVGRALLGAAGHALSVLGHGVFGSEVWVDGGEELRGWVVFAEGGHFVGDGGVCVGEVWVEGLFHLDPAVFLGGVIDEFVGGIAVVVEASGGGGEMAGAAHGHAAGAEDDAWCRHGCGCVGRCESESPMV